MANDVAPKAEAKGVGQGPGNTAPRGPIAASPGAFRIGGLGDPMRSRWLKLLIYGPPGAGKTTLLGSAVDVPAMRDVLFVSIEAGELALEENDRVKNSELIDVIRMTDIEQLHKLLDFMKLHCRARDAGDEKTLAKLQAQVFGFVPDDVGRTGGTPWPAHEELMASIGRLRRYKALIIDSLTEIEAKNLSKVMGLDNEKAFELGNIEVSGWGEFRQNNHTMQRIVRAFRDLPINLFLVCTQTYTQDERKVFHYAPTLTGKLTQQVQGFMDVVGYLVVSGAAAEEMGDKDASSSQRRRMYIQPQAGVKFDAKNRRASYKRGYFNDPTMLDIMRGFKMPIDA